MPLLNAQELAELDELLRAPDDYELWLKDNFPFVATKPLAERHKRLWSWFAGLTPGIKPRPRVEVWPRGGAKSSTGELGCAFVGQKLTRRFVLYVSGTQDQADLHVQSIASLFESVGIERAISKYGHSKGWRRDQLRTANGFNVAAYGLDTAARGVKLDQYRPDLIIFDDIDGQDDSPKTVEKKTQAIKSAVIPAGSSDCAVLFLQNLIHEEGIVTRLTDGRADFLLTREVSDIEPAVYDLKTELYKAEAGQHLYRIVGGTASWEGQNLETCTAQINEWGLKTFLRESQHEVYGADGYFFDAKCIGVVTDLPRLLRYCRAWDLAATEGGGDYTVGVLMGIAPNGNIYILDVKRGQWESDKVRRTIDKTHQEDLEQYGPMVTLKIPQDPGQAGKAQASQFRQSLEKPSIKPVTGNKAVRARGFQACVNSRNAYMLEADWNHHYREELRKFREDLEHEYDDQVDASADAYNELAKPTTKSTVKRGSWA